MPPITCWGPRAASFFFAEANRKYGQLLKEVQALEDLQKKGDNILEASATSFKTLQTTAVTSLHAAIDKRLRPANLTMILDEDGCDNADDNDRSISDLQSRGRSCIASLRENMQKLEPLGAFLAALNPKKDFVLKRI